MLKKWIEKIMNEKIDFGWYSSEIIRFKQKVQETNERIDYLTGEISRLESDLNFWHRKWAQLDNKIEILLLPKINETDYLLQHTANAERLRESIKQFEEGKFEKHDLIED